MKIQTESRKGQECLFKPIICEQGYCRECQIYIDYLGYLRSMGRLTNLLPEWLVDWEIEQNYQVKEET